MPDPERIATAADATELKEEVNQRAKPFLPDDHFTVDGTLIQAWASQKSFRAKAGSGDGDGSNFHGQKRSNQTQESTTDPDARLYKKSYGKESHLASLGLPERGVRPQGELRSKTVGRPKPGRSKPVKGTSTLNKTALLDENQPRQHNNAHEKQASQQKFKKVLKMANWLGKATPMRLRSISHRVTSSFIPPGNSGTNFMQSGRGTSPETPRQPDR